MQSISDFVCTGKALDGGEELGMELTVGEKKVSRGGRWE